jgi:hypothetical protein
MPESEPPTGITAATRWGTYLHVPKTGFLADPHDVTSGLDHHVQAQLDSVHAETGASISAHSTPLLDSGQEDRIIGMAQGAGRSHLEENVKDAFASAQPLDRASIPRREGKLLIWITGSTIESVSLGRVGILVLADQVVRSSHPRNPELAEQTRGARRPYMSTLIPSYSRYWLDGIEP